jgi:protein involved in polysaccharide export with SLBB domain
MIKFCNYIVIVIISFFFQSCSEILEPVLFKIDKKSYIENAQEEFDINISTLTFENAAKANQDGFPRKLMLKGSGGRADVIDESELLVKKIPNHLNSKDYKLGYLDEITFEYVNEFINENVKWPPIPISTAYKMGAGDVITFIQISDIRGTSGLVPNNSDVFGVSSPDDIIETNGVIGSDGKVLLLGIGSLDVGNHTLDEVRSKVRNILIRNGQTPNFQLEITKFKSQKVFLSNPGKIEETLYLNNIPKSLQEITLNSSVSSFQGDLALISLTRDKIEYNYTATQLFDTGSPQIIIQENDLIKLQINNAKYEKYKTTIGSNGYILLPIVGNINTKNLSLNELQLIVKEAIIEKGYKPEFQLELTNFKSKKIYISYKNEGSQIINLTNFNTTLKEIILRTNNFKRQIEGLSLITLKRDKESYQLSLDEILNLNTPDIWVQDGDQIEFEHIAYKPGQVFALSGVGNARVIEISPSVRQTLADVMFSSNGAINNLSAKRSEIYLLRGRSPAIAYHLDAQNVSRILVAAKTELRPNDIIYVAERPIISFTRVLSEIAPLRILLRDLENGNIP